MGVETVDCGRVAELIGIKTFINEFVAYTALSKYISNRNNLTWYEGMNFTDYNATWHYQDKDIVYDHMNITLDKGILQVCHMNTFDKMYIQALTKLNSRGQSLIPDKIKHSTLIDYDFSLRVNYNSAT